MKKRVVSFLLIVGMIASLIPCITTMASAEDVDYKFEWPLRQSYYISGLDSYYNGGTHNGIDVVPDGYSGQAVYPVADGQVIGLCTSYTGPVYDNSWGNYVMLQHVINGEVFYSVYAHMEYGSISVGYNSIVTTETQIGKMGNTGHSYGEHLHFEIYTGERTWDKVGKTFDYYQNNQEVLTYLQFNPGLVNNSPRYGNWILENCELVDGRYCYIPKSTISRDVVLVIDVSSSMQGDRFDNMKTAAKEFVTQLLSSAKKTRIAIISYSGDIVGQQKFTNDQAILTDFIDNMGLEWTGTNIYAALERAQSCLVNSNAEKKGIVLMTDGGANVGVKGTSGIITVKDYNTDNTQKKIYVSAYGDAIYSLAEDIKAQDISLYSIGFNLEQNSVPYNLMKYIASGIYVDPYFYFDRYFWNITNDNIDDILFTFVDIAETIDGKDKIVISIHCPVEASVSYEEEVLDRDNLITSFGRVTISEVDDGYEYLFTMDDLTDYEINIQGTGEGTMDFKLTYVKETATHYREFLNVPITADTKITTTATDSASDFSLYVDSDGDGEDDERWTAGIDETVTEMTEDLTEDSSLYWSLLLLLGGVNDGSNIPMEQIFTDIQKTDWFYKETAFVYANGLMQGTSATTFAPNATLTRAMLVQVLFNLEGKPAVDASSGFADVAAGAWYFDAVSWAAENGIVTGYAADRFGPEDAVTREQTAAIFQRYAAYRGLDTSASGSLSQFADAAAVSAYAQHAVAWAVDTGLLSGKGSGKLDPAGTATRAEIAAILMRFCENVLK